MDPSTIQQSELQPPESNPKRRPLVRIFVIAALTILALLVITYLAALAGKIFIRPDWARKLGLPTATLRCVRPTLTLGAASFPLEALPRPVNGGIPADIEAGKAWWFADTYSPFVFLLKPGADIPDVQAALKLGDPLVVEWADCGREEFGLKEIQPGAPDAAALLAQSTTGIAVIIQAEGGRPTYVLHGERPALAQPETPEPTNPNAIQADITFGETAVSVDEKTLQTSLTITNTGSKLITVNPTDLSLTAEGKAPLSPLNVEPALPQEIQPGGSLSLTITFPNPGGSTAVLKVLDTTLDLYY